MIPDMKAQDLKATDVEAPELPNGMFTNENCEDKYGNFQIHGLVDAIGIVWFVKLYSHHGWLYRGRLDSDLRTFKGTWGSYRKLWYGTFELRRSSSDDHDQ